jgi:hypothetical protein
MLRRASPQRLGHGGYIGLVERRDKDAVTLLLDEPQTPDRSGTPLAVYLSAWIGSLPRTGAGSFKQTTQNPLKPARRIG